MILTAKVEKVYQGICHLLVTFSGFSVMEKINTTFCLALCCYFYCFIVSRHTIRCISLDPIEGTIHM